MIARELIDGKIDLSRDEKRTKAKALLLHTCSAEPVKIFCAVFSFVARHKETVGWVLCTVCSNDGYVPWCHSPLLAYSAATKGMSKRWCTYTLSRHQPFLLQFCTEKRKVRRSKGAMLCQNAWWDPFCPKKKTDMVVQTSRHETLSNVGHWEDIGGV